MCGWDGVRERRGCVWRSGCSVMVFMVAFCLSYCCLVRESVMTGKRILSNLCLPSLSGEDAFSYELVQGNNKSRL